MNSRTTRIATAGHEPNFTSETGKEPDDNVPTVGAGTRMMALTFPNGAIVPIRTRELAAAKKEANLIGNRIRKLGAQMTPEQKAIARKQFFAAEQKVRRAEQRAYAKYAVTEVAPKTYEVDPDKYPGLVHAWRAAIRTELPAAA